MQRQETRGERETKQGEKDKKDERGQKERGLELITC